ncbi:MAG: hypothetical protein WC073_10825 [Sterolibacterium sp.]
MPALLQILFVATAIAGAVWLESLGLTGLMLLIIGLGVARFLLFPFTR